MSICGRGLSIAPLAVLATVATFLPPQPALAAGAPALEPPPAAVVTEARAIVQEMKKGERGPYQRIRWYCKDGTAHPAQPYPCADRGGGNQHAEYSPARARLAELGWSVGTILLATPAEEVLDEGRRNGRLREIALERYLIETDDGWVMRKARYYRGWSQIEDEEVAGRELLRSLLSRPAWVEANFLLARESVRTLPHHSGSADRTRRVRRQSKDVAALDPSFEKIRIKLHTNPAASDIDEVDSWLKAARGRGAERTVLEGAAALLQELKALYGDAGRAERLMSYSRRLTDPALKTTLAPLLEGVVELKPADRVARLAGVLARIRDRVVASPDGALNLLLLDLSLDAEAELVSAAYEEIRDAAATRRTLLATGLRLLDASYGAGLLSARERDALGGPLTALAATPAAPTDAYLAACRGLERAGTFALRTVFFTYAEPLARYAALEPKATRFPDDVLRASPVLPLTTLASHLARDAEERASLPHVVFGKEAGAVAGLNPGVAAGVLRVVTEEQLAADPTFDPSSIVVLPRVVAELKPVAGILSLTEGNILSHVQILARNLGIPNATLSPALAESLKAHDGEKVVLAVGGDGSLLLDRLDRMPAAVLAEIESPKDGPRVETQLQAPAPDLTVARPLPLVELKRELSGKVVGPKAANAGELARLFPGHVAAAIALPFGVYAAHVNAGPDSPKPRLDRAFAGFRAGIIDEATLGREIEAVAEAIRKTPISLEMRAALLPMMAEQFGPPGSYGVFVRSDTNVEDLPAFTGAGLNLTVPNVVGLAEQFKAISRVWASPFESRAMAWRRQALTNPEEVYPSVLLMKSVNSDKSGVLVTKDLTGAGEGITVATAWGVGGAVDGEAAETIVLRPDGSVTLAGDAKAPYRRQLKADGGVEWPPAPSGTILTAAEQAALRDLAAQARERLTPEIGASGQALAWDMEFGFAAGKLVLFQVRPLRERGRASADRVLRALDLKRGVAQATTPLDQRPDGGEAPAAALAPEPGAAKP